jgi:hypothetical protein
MAALLVRLLNSPITRRGASTLMSASKEYELAARRKIEDQGFVVHDANVLFHVNCENIDLVVYGKDRPIYVQVKSSSKPAGRDRVGVGGTWTNNQLFRNDPIFNEHDSFQAEYVIVVDATQGEDQFYVVPPMALAKIAQEVGRLWAEKPKKDGFRRSVGFRKEVPRDRLTQWRDAWHHLGKPLPAHCRARR